MHLPLYPPQPNLHLHLQPQPQHWPIPCPPCSPLTVQLGYRPGYLGPMDGHSLMQYFENGVRGLPYGLPSGAIGPTIPAMYIGYRMQEGRKQKGEGSDEGVKEPLPKLKLPQIINSPNQKIYCVICQQYYWDSQRQYHIQKHNRISKPSQPLQPPQPSQPSPPSQQISNNLQKLIIQKLSQQNKEATLQTSKNSRIETETARPGKDSREIGGMFILSDYQSAVRIDSVKQSSLLEYGSSGQRPQMPEFRFSRDTFITDEPSQPIGLYTGRETVQSMQSNEFHIQEDSSLELKNIYLRDTVQSRESTQNQLTPTPYQPRMSPIHQQSQLRNTFDSPQKQSSFNSSSNNNPTQPPSQIPIPPASSFGKKNPTRPISYATQKFSFDDFTGPFDQHLIPRENRASIPIQRIIKDRLN